MATLQTKKTSTPYATFFSTIKNFFADKRKKTIFIGGILLLIVSFLIIRNRITTKAVKNTASKVSQITVNRSLDFQGLDNRGFKRGRIKFTINTAEKTTEVFVNNQRFQATNEKVFLLLNLEYTNDTTQPLNIVPNDLVRLVYNGNNDKKFSADLHNNTVSIAAISTKQDRMGFVIPKSATDLKLLVGELESAKKEEVLLLFVN